jgi:Fe-S-cluster-containing hydrogenase component 2
MGFSASVMAVDPKNSVGSTCANICPPNAIAFPSFDAVWKLERKRRIFRTVKKETQWKHD